MIAENNNDIYIKGTVLWALANRAPDFSSFYEQYQNEIVFNNSLPIDFVDEVMDVVEADPIWADMAKRYQENVQNSMTFSISGLPEVSIMIAALFLLSTHIKIHKKPNGKWEILMEHKSVGDGKLEMIAQMILDLFKK